MMQPETVAGEDGGEIGRVRTGVPGLDAVLCGGFLRGGLYMILGPPGLGKTILASQVIYAGASDGGRALYINVLGENQGRMMAHLRPMRFFDETRIPDHVAYINVGGSLEDDGLPGLLSLINREVLSRKADFLVLDGISAIGVEGNGAAFAMKRFTHALETLASSTDCTMLLLNSVVGAMDSPEHTMVDGIIELRQHPVGSRTERRLLVRKMRGSDFLAGEHAFRITRDGFTVFPRVEALLAMPTRRVPPPRTRLSTGVTSLDDMFGGGIPKATMTGLVGPSGAGKTTLGLHFLSGSNADEPGLLFGCYEPPERLHYKAATIGLDLAAAEERGDVEIIWNPMGEYILDELAYRLLDAVRRRGVKRLFIDGIAGFQQATLEPERIVRFWSALTHELRALGVTTLHTMELQELTGPNVRMPLGGIASLAEVMVLMRYVELRSRLFRLISLFKVREGGFDPTIREFTIGDAGIVVGKPFAGVEAVLSGVAREIARDQANGLPGNGNLGVPDDGTGQLG